MNVILVEPAFPQNQREFARALHTAGARVIGIGERPSDYLDPELKHWLADYEQVRSVVHEPSMLEAVRRIQSRVWVDRMEATVEAHILTAARVREQCGIPGTSERTSYLCRDKPAMKEALRQAGVACAQSDGVNSESELRKFIERVGLPIILKPRDGAGAAGTHKIEHEDQIAGVVQASGLDQGASVAAEEFIVGHEGFYDTLCVEGEPRHEFATHYYPNVLEAMRTRWISPQFITTNRLGESGYDEVREMARSVIRALGIGTSATHMEWFSGPKGLRFSEIGCRPPGVGAWDLYCAANEMDLYAEWGRAVTGQGPGDLPSRRYSAGMIALRPDRDGRIDRYSGRDWLESEIGEWIIDQHFPAPGTATQPVEAGYMANAWIRIRHPDYDRLREMLDLVGQRVRVWAS